MRNKVERILNSIGKNEKKKYELNNNIVEIQKIDNKTSELHFKLIELIPDKNFDKLEFYYKELLIAYKEYYIYLDNNEEDGYLTSIETIERMRHKVISLI